MSELFTVGIVGCGAATQAAHIPALASLPKRFRATTFADDEPAMAAGLAERCTGTATGFDDLIRSCDVVLIAGSIDRRAQAAVAACRAGVKGIYVEPPCGLTSSEAEAVSTAAQESGTEVVVGAIHVFDPAFRAGLNLMEDLGERALLARVITTYTSQEPAHGAQTSVLHPERDRDLKLATIAALCKTAGPDAPEFLFDLFSMLMEACIHDLPIVSKVLGTAVAERATSFDHGYEVGLRCGEIPVRMTARKSKIRRTDWRFELVARDAHVRVEFPPNVLSGVAGRAVRFDSLGTVEPPLVNETGYREAWRQLHRAITDGADVDYTPADAARDHKLLERILRVASGLSETPARVEGPAVVHIGAGRIAPVHLGMVAGEAPIARVVSRTSVAAERMAQMFGAEHSTFEDEGFLEGAGAVIVAGVPATHSRDAIAAVERRMSVLVEKPLTRTLAEAWQLREAVRANGGTFVYGENWAFQDIVQRAARVCNDRGLQSVRIVARWLRPSWGQHMDPAYGGAAVFDGGPHPIELSRLLLGRVPAEWVEADLEPADGDSPDLDARVRIGFASGKYADIEISWSGQTQEIFAEAPGFRLELAPRRHLEVEGVPIKVEKFSGVGAGLVAAGYRAQVLALLGRGPVQAGIDDGVAVMEIISAAYQSAGAGKRVVLPFQGPPDLSPYELWKGELRIKK